MAASAPEEAVDAFIARVQAALDCVFLSTAFGSGNRVAHSHTVVFYQVGQSQPNIARLRTHGGVGELLLELAYTYAAVRSYDASGSQTVKVEPSHYQYKILDFDENEIVIYD